LPCPYALYAQTLARICFVRFRCPQCFERALAGSCGGVTVSDLFLSAVLSKRSCTYRLRARPAGRRVGRSVDRVDLALLAAIGLEEKEQTKGRGTWSRAPASPLAAQLQTALGCCGMRFIAARCSRRQLRTGVQQQPPSERPRCPIRFSAFSLFELYGWGASGSTSLLFGTIFRDRAIRFIPRIISEMDDRSVQQYKTSFRSFRFDMDVTRRLV